VKDFFLAVRVGIGEGVGEGEGMGVEVGVGEIIIFPKETSGALTATILPISVFPNAERTSSVTGERIDSAANTATAKMGKICIPLSI
jgi:hypothetical protein